MGGGAGGIEMPRQTWINEITVTADAGNPGRKSLQSTCLPTVATATRQTWSRGASMQMALSYLQTAGCKEGADARARSRAKGLRVGQGLPRTPAGKTKNAEARCLEPQMRCP